eukprot:Rmarinus@m.17165
MSGWLWGVRKSGGAAPPPTSAPEISKAEESESQEKANVSKQTTNVSEEAHREDVSVPVMPVAEIPEQDKAQLNRMQMERLESVTRPTCEMLASDPTFKAELSAVTDAVDVAHGRLDELDVLKVNYETSEKLLLEIVEKAKLLESIYARIDSMEAFSGAARAATDKLRDNLKQCEMQHGDSTTKVKTLLSSAARTAFGYAEYVVKNDPNYPPPAPRTNPPALDLTRPSKRLAEDGLSETYGFIPDADKCISSLKQS